MKMVEQIFEVPCAVSSGWYLFSGSFYILEVTSWKADI
jgi:hypothetical protein